MSTQDKAMVSRLFDLVATTDARGRTGARQRALPRTRRRSRLQLESLESREVPTTVAATIDTTVEASPETSSEVLQASQMSAFFEQSSLYTDGQPTTDPTTSWEASHPKGAPEGNAPLALAALRLLDELETILTSDQPGSASVMEDFYGYDNGGGGLDLGVPFLRVERAWPAQVFAPYVDLDAWPTFELAHRESTRSLRYFHLAFISADEFNRPAWGGDQQRTLGSEFDLSLRRQVSDLRARGGDVAVSFGGPQRLELAQVITDVEKLKRTYRDVVDTYGLVRIDFYLQTSSLDDAAANDRRARALASLERDLSQEGRKLEVWFTLPAGPEGLSRAGVQAVDTALARGVTLDGVNIRPRGHGDALAAGSSARMGAVTIESAINVFYQLDKSFHRQETAGEVWRKIGITPTIGQGQDAGERFLPADAEAVFDFARQQGVGMLGEWSINRDQYDSSLAAPGLTSGVEQHAFEFSDIFAPFTEAK